MDFADINVPIAAVFSALAVVIGAAIFIGRALLQLNHRLTTLEGADDTDTKLRLTAVERRQDELMSHANVSDWERFRERTENRLASLEKTKRAR